RFRIVMSTIGVPGFKKSIETYEVGFAQLSQKIQNIHRMNGKILSLTEID
ncbi:MAG: photosystem I reaction center subunit XII, partial [Hydrococcus sp. CRU_1_1]|nr:photosystem I reaction center subunit XII [Hydrococcus sp. CRU_1_1]